MRCRCARCRILPSLCYGRHKSEEGAAIKHYFVLIALAFVFTLTACSAAGQSESGSVTELQEDGTVASVESVNSTQGERLSQDVSTSQTPSSTRPTTVGPTATPTVLPTEEPSVSLTPTAHPLDGLVADVTFEEYEKAAFAFRDCMVAGGSEVSEFWLNPETRIYTHSMSLPQGAASVNACYADFEYFDSTWQLAVRAELERLGIDDLKQELRGCLDKWGLPWKEDEHKGILAVRLAENGIFQVTCDYIDR